MIRYIVKKGDTLGKISRNVCGSSGLEGKIMVMNSLPNINQIFEGQTLLLPEKDTPSILPNNPNEYIVQYGDSLFSIAKRYLGSGERWKEIAKLNQISQPDHILVGQILKLPPHANRLPPSSPGSISNLIGDNAKFRAKYIPARAFFFIVADEILPGGKTVRKVAFPHKIQNNPELVKRIINPEKYGIHSIKPDSPVSLGRHVLGRTDSNYISVSKRLFGSPRFEGKRYWINMEKVKESGAVVHDAAEIAEDLERIAKKTKKTDFLEYIEDIKGKSRLIDKEFAIQGSIPPSAIKGALSQGLTHGFQLISCVGVILSVNDLYRATTVSIQKESIKPLATEGFKQGMGWAGAVAGAKLGTMVGALFGIETGPGAVLTAAGGGVLFGIAGFFGAEWITEYIDKEEAF